MKTVENEGEQLRNGNALYRQNLGDLGQIAGQGQLFQIVPDAAELPFGVGLFHHPSPLILIEDHLGPAKKLAPGGDGAALFSAAPGGGGDFAHVSSKEGQDLVRLLIIPAPQHKGLGGDVHYSPL